MQLKNCTKDNLKNDLPINEDYYEIMVKQQKLNFHIQSTGDYFNFVKACAEHYKERKILLAGGKTPRFSDVDIYDLLIEYKLIYISVIPYKDKKKN